MYCNLVSIQARLPCPGHANLCGYVKFHSKLGNTCLCSRSESTNDSRNPHSNQMKHDVLALLRTGKSMKDIGILLSVDESIIKNILKGGSLSKYLTDN